MSNLCPCHSGAPYTTCCQPYHEGLPAENALKLMRSRYSAYALHLADYIIATTHPQNPAYQTNHPKWKKEILDHTHKTAFESLKILEFVDGKTEATVTFHAGLSQHHQDISFTEKSSFLKVDGRWYYLSGTSQILREF
jgi:SEC-C motif-containing protein